MTDNCALPSDRLVEFAFDEHNAEVRRTWDAYNSGRPYRVPTILGTNTRYFMFNAAANPAGVDFHSYTESPALMFETQLRFERWRRFNLLQDVELGTPDRWTIGVDFQNYYEAAWFGCTVEYPPGEVPDARPAFVDCPERVMEKGLPDPFGGIMGKGLGYYEYFRDRADHEEFLGLPISIGGPGFGLGTDGPFTLACSLFGPKFTCTALASEPDRIRVLLEFITEATIRRMAAWRRFVEIPMPQEGFGMADDSIALISTRMYREQILPHHRRIYNAFATPGPRGIHLCGDSTRHFVTLRDELNVRSFDTGFPVDFGKLRRDLGHDVRIQGGPHVEFLLAAAPAQIREEVARIFATGILEGGMFVLREGNNLAPGTPIENTEAMVAAGREFGAIGEER